MGKFLKEFKDFALKGNVMDMAVGVIIGAAFGAIVASLTDSFINPLINSIGGSEVAGKIKLPWVDYDKLDPEIDPSTLMLNYGAFITAVINFLIMAFILFLLIKGINTLMSIGKKEEEAAPAEPSDEVKLLTEIKDILANK
ncbi:MAG: large conductance mechanosensitive channel protein MscL [Lachnospiraceae bacterium]|nr:large conductance mechanosensitive channel protein MscL [Lachnospiraceae bacterium]